jgi:hypothetical protein
MKNIRLMLMTLTFAVVGQTLATITEVLNPAASKGKAKPSFLNNPLLINILNSRALHSNIFVIPIAIAEQSKQKPDPFEMEMQRKREDLFRREVLAQRRAGSINTHITTK